jgi:hypothetical protein
MVSLQVERASAGRGAPQQIIVKLKRASAMMAGENRGFFGLFFSPSQRLSFDMLTDILFQMRTE